MPNLRCSLNNKRKNLVLVSPEQHFARCHNYEQLIQSFPKNPSKHTIYRSKFALDLTTGSDYFLLFLQAVKNMGREDQQIFKEIIKFKWYQVKYISYFIILLYTLLNIFYTLALFKIQPLAFFIVSLGLLLILIALEVKGAIWDIKSHITEIYNMIDLALFVLLLVNISMNLSQLNEERSEQLETFSFFCLFFTNARNFLEFRVFSQFRWIIQMIMIVFKDIFFFILVMVMVIYANTILMHFSAFREGEESLFGHRFADSFSMTMGNLEISYEWNVWIWITVVTFSITLIVILLNMLISIVGETFQNFLSNQKYINL